MNKRVQKRSLSTSQINDYVNNALISITRHDISSTKRKTQEHRHLPFQLSALVMLTTGRPLNSGQFGHNGGETVSLSVPRAHFVLSCL